MSVEKSESNATFGFDLASHWLRKGQFCSDWARKREGIIRDCRRVEGGYDIGTKVDKRSLI